MADSLPPVPLSVSPALMHERRVRRMLLLGSSVFIATCLYWGVFFMLRGDWVSVVLDGSGFAAGTATQLLTRRGHLRVASRLLMAAAYVVIVINAVVFDIPSADVPRSVHAYLIALGVASCLITHNEPRWLRHGIPGLCFLSFVLLNSSHIAWPTPYSFPENVRAYGVWINHAIALATVLATLHVILNDVDERHGTESELRDALVRRELLLHFQPQIGPGERVIGAEALLRWKHPRRGMVPPGDFIPLAERSGLMLPMGEWVLQAACAQLAAWSRRPDTRELVLAINVSASQFAQDDFVARVLAALDHARAPATRLKIELTESLLAHDLDDVIAKMSVLKTHGITFSLDDFGTGFSSLSYLRRLPLQQLKIDQSFVRAMLDSPNDAAIARTIIDLGRSLGLEVIAEGVETMAQWDALSDLGCGCFQGFLFSRPLPLDDFHSFVARSAAREAEQREVAETLRL